MSVNRKRRIIAVALAFVVVAAAFIFYIYDPAEMVLFPKCPFLLLTGYECPGCGTQRAIHSLLHLDFRGAAAHNALILFLIPYMLLGVYLELYNGKRQFPKLENFFFGKWAALLVVVVLFAYWLLRNL